MESCLKLQKELHEGWVLTSNPDRLFRKVIFKDFKRSMDLAVKIGELAQEQWHHPDLKIGWGFLDIEIWTHKINGLVESDFIFAAKTDQIISSYL